MIRNLFWYLRAWCSPWGAYVHFRNLCAQELGTGGKPLVLRGPFAGMEIVPHGAAIQLPMLVGSYELEIWPFLREVEKGSMLHSIHLGAANGYFAVGFAWKFRHQVSAYEPRPDDRAHLLDAARRNGVEERISIREACTPEDLAREISRPGTMIFCDIDGGEEELLDPDRLPRLRQTPLLVETHPRLQQAGHTRDLLRARFSSSHAIQEAGMQNRFPHEMGAFSETPGAFRLRGLQNEILASALEERRGENTWLWMVPRLSGDAA